MAPGVCLRIQAFSLRAVMSLFVLVGVIAADRHNRIHILVVVATTTIVHL